MSMYGSGRGLRFFLLSSCCFGAVLVIVLIARQRERLKKVQETKKTPHELR